MIMNKKGSSTLSNCIVKLKVAGYSRNTINIYMSYIKSFLYSNKKSPAHLSSSDFQSYIDNYKFTSISQQNQIINSLKFLFEFVLKRKTKKVEFTRPKKSIKLPKVLDKGYLIKSIGNIKNLKHKAILSLSYSVGLRVSEVLNLKISDVDSKRMTIKINQSKNNKDRIVPLSTNLLILLRDYFKEFKPKVFLFNGLSKGKYSPSSCNKLIKKYIGKEYSMHSLRHSCFTHLVEDNTSLRLIQKLAGHSSSKTTEIYTQVSRNSLSKINLPI